jgi:phospholipid/cholesterol/gamma-HCH transport system substrate-binding protein
VLEALGFYKRELTAFFANTVAATQATTVSNKGPLHYLRTMNPFNPENLAVYPKRLPTNRPNPYAFPGTFDQIRTGLPQFETRHCDRGGIPTIDNTAQQVAPSEPLPQLSLPVPIPALVPDSDVVDGLYKLPDKLIDDIIRFGFPGGVPNEGPAPPCKQQPKFTFQGETSQYPHVKPR